MVQSRSIALCRWDVEDMFTQIDVDREADSAPPLGSSLEPAELGRLLDHVASDVLGPLIETLASTGLRRGEAFGLRWDDVDLERHMLAIRQQLTQDPAGTPAHTVATVMPGWPFAPPKTASGMRMVDLDRTTTGTLLAHRFTQRRYPPARQGIRRSRTGVRGDGRHAALPRCGDEAVRAGSWTSSRLMMARSVVVFPAPLAPRRATADAWARPGSPAQRDDHVVVDDLQVAYRQDGFGGFGGPRSQSSALSGGELSKQSGAQAQRSR